MFMKMVQENPNRPFPHGYDLVVDTEGVQWASNNRIDVIFDAHRRTQQRMGVPVMVGEWVPWRLFRRLISY